MNKIERVRGWLIFFAILRPFQLFSVFHLYQEDGRVKSIWRQCCHGVKPIGIGAWQIVYIMFHEFFNDVTTKILSTVTSDFLKQMLILKSFNSVL